MLRSAFNAYRAVPSAGSLLRTRVAVERINTCHESDSTSAQTLRRLPKRNTVALSYSQRRFMRWSQRMRKMKPEEIEVMVKNATDPEANSSKSRRRTIDVTGVVIDPKLPSPMGSPFTKAFYQELWSRTLRQANIWAITPWRMRSIARDKGVPKVKRAEILTAAKDIFESYNKMVAEGKLSELEELCAEQLNYTLRQKYGRRKVDHTKQYVWDCKDLSIKIMNSRIFELPPPINSTFLQVIVEITASQRLRVLDKDGNMIAGKEEFVGPVVDHWAIEKALAPGAQWKLCATDIQAAAAPPEAMTSA